MVTYSLSFRVKVWEQGQRGSTHDTAGNLFHLGTNAAPSQDHRLGDWNLVTMITDCVAPRPFRILVKTITTFFAAGFWSRRSLYCSSKAFESSGQDGYCIVGLRLSRVLVKTITVLFVKIFRDFWSRRSLCYSSKAFQGSGQDHDCVFRRRLPRPLVKTITGGVLCCRRSRR